MTERLEFGGPEWTQRIKEVFEDAVASGGDATFSISERYLDPPAHLVPAAGDLGWTCRIAGNAVEFTTEPADDVDVAIIADYQSILPAARLPHSDPVSAAESQALTGALVADGRLRVVAKARPPAFLSGVHDRMAAVTA